MKLWVVGDVSVCVGNCFASVRGDFSMSSGRRRAVGRGERAAVGYWVLFEDGGEGVKGSGTSIAQDLPGPDISRANFSDGGGRNSNRQPGKFVPRNRESEEKHYGRGWRV